MSDKHSLMCSILYKFWCEEILFLHWQFFKEFVYYNVAAKLLLSGLQKVGMHYCTVFHPNFFFKLERYNSEANYNDACVCELWRVLLIFDVLTQNLFVFPFSLFLLNLKWRETLLIIKLDYNIRKWIKVKWEHLNFCLFVCKLIKNKLCIDNHNH